MARLKRLGRGAGSGNWIKGADGKFNGSRPGSPSKVLRTKIRLQLAQKRAAKTTAELAKASPTKAAKLQRKLARSERKAAFHGKVLAKEKAKPMAPKPTKADLKARSLARIDSSRKAIWEKASDKSLRSFGNRLRDARRRGAKVDARGEMKHGTALLKAAKARNMYGNAKWRIRFDNAQRQREGKVPIRSDTSVFFARERLRGALKRLRESRG